MDITWIKDKLIQFAMSRLRILMLDGVDVAIEVIKDNRTQQFLDDIKRPEHKMIMKLLLEIVEDVLKKFDGIDVVAVRADPIEVKLVTE